MVKAFENLTEDERLALAARSIDLEASFRNWMGKLLGEEPNSERIDALILKGNKDGLRTMAAEETPLSPTEMKVLALTACGLTAIQVGQECHLALETIKSHSKEIRRKLGARNTTHAVTLALAKGVFDEALAA